MEWCEDVRCWFKPAPREAHDWAVEEFTNGSRIKAAKIMRAAKEMGRRYIESHGPNPALPSRYDVPMGLREAKK